MKSVYDINPFYDGFNCKANTQSLQSMKGIEKYDGALSITFQDNLLTAIDAEKCMPSVLSLSLRSNQISDISNIGEIFPNLTFLDCSMNCFTTFEGIHKLENLKTLISMNINVQDFSDIANLKNLQKIYFKFEKAYVYNVYKSLKDTNLQFINSWTKQKAMQEYKEQIFENRINTLTDEI